MERLVSREELRRFCASVREQGKTVALVPTMGALHDGHLSLIDRAQAADPQAVVVASIFVNPQQFAPHEDMARYPRTLEADLAALRARGVEAVFTPKSLYASGHCTTVALGGPGLGLCADRRPHFFPGVATVVVKLLMLTQAGLAVFGEKDYQQLQCLKAVVRDLDMPVTLVAAPTVRDSSGLALSSRNRYLSPVQHAIAPHLYATLVALKERMCAHEPYGAKLKAAHERMLSAGFSEVEYLALRHADLSEPSPAPAPGVYRLLAAVRLDEVRLIDNIALTL